ncbi:MAG: hypothetical protein VCA40_06855 [Roseibacillus sp.]
MKALIPVLIGVLVVGCEKKEALQVAEAEVEAAVPVIATYEGRIGTASYQGSPDGFSFAATGPTEIIIRTQADYEAFVARLPQRQITKTNPAPPSDDPLLKKPAIDFENNIMLVAIRSDSMYVSPQFESIVADKNALIVRISDPDLGETGSANQQGGIGTYQAVVVPKRKGPIQFIR